MAFYLMHVPRIVYNVYLVEVNEGEDPSAFRTSEYVGAVDSGELGWDESVRGDAPDFFGPYNDRQDALGSSDARVDYK